jgi:hypothetical protein
MSRNFYRLVEVIQNFNILLQFSKNEGKLNILDILNRGSAWNIYLLESLPIKSFRQYVFWMIR